MSRSRSGRPLQDSGPAPAWSHPDLLAGKLAPPPLGFPPLPRPRLLQALSSGVAGTPVTLVSGPAGSGKTVLASSWARTQHGHRPVAWLSLDPEDDDPAVFWPYLVAALERAGIHLPAGAPDPAAGEPAPTGWPVWLAGALATLRQQVVLVLDNADCLTGRDLCHALDLLVLHAGTRLRLVLCARADPLLPLHRYRVEGRLTELRTDELAFTADETAALLTSLGAPVSTDVAAALQQQTEGWVAALRLAAAPLARGMDPASLVTELTADEGSVAQYLAAEVLDQQPAPVRRYLLRMSTTRELWPDLVDRLAGRSGTGRRALGALASANAFVERVAGAPGGFHIHALFRELLQAQFAYEDPEGFTACHRVCAGYYADTGRLAVAVEHAATAGDHELAARLLIDDLAVGAVLAGGAIPDLPSGGTEPDTAVLRAAAAVARNEPATQDLAVAAHAAADWR